MKQSSETLDLSSGSTRSTEATFLQTIQEELAVRQVRNARYSLRRFARSLALDASFLSKLLSGKRALHPALIRRLGKALGLSPSEIETFVENPSRWGTGEVRKRRPTAKARFESLSLPVFSQVANWYHFAILSLTQIPGLELNPVSISERLGITPAQAEQAVFHLVSLGLLTRDPRGKLDCPKNATTVRHHLSNDTLVQLQKQYLKGAINAMQRYPLDLRDQSAMTMAIRKDALPEAKQRLREFRRDFMERMEAKDGKDAVYQLCLSFYPVESCGP